MKRTNPALTANLMNPLHGVERFFPATELLACTSKQGIHYMELKVGIPGGAGWPPAPGNPLHGVESILLSIIVRAKVFWNPLHGVERAVGATDPLTGDIANPLHGVERYWYLTLINSVYEESITWS